MIWMGDKGCKFGFGIFWVDGKHVLPRDPSGDGFLRRRDEMMIRE